MYVLTHTYIKLKRNIENKAYIIKKKLTLHMFLI